MKHMTTWLAAVASLTACSGEAGAPQQQEKGDKGDKGGILSDPRFHVQNGVMMFEDYGIGPASQFLDDGAGASGGDQPGLHIESTSHFDLSRGVVNVNVKPWPNGQVFLKWDTGANTTGTAARNLLIAEADWLAKAPIEFKVATGPTGTVAVNTTPATAGNPPNCVSSSLGAGNYQVFIGDCPSWQAVAHEMGHVIGMMHEQQRPDRNNYIIVNWCNSNNGDPGACTLDSTSVVQGLYDYSSIMQYPTQFNSAGVGSITTTSGGTIFPATEVSEYDGLGVSIMYGAELEQTLVSLARNGRSDIFVRGDPDGLIHWANQASGQKTTFTSIGGPNNQPTVGMPAAVSWGASRIDLFVRSLARDIYHNVYNGSSWSGWTKMGSGPASSNPTAVSWAQNRLDMFYKSANSGSNANVIHYFSNDGGANWVSENLGGSARGEPRVISRASGFLDVVIVQGDSQLYHRGYNAATNSWTPPLTSNWEPLGGDAFGLPALGSPSATSFDVMVRGRDTRIWHKAWRSGTWNPSGTGWEATNEGAVYGGITAIAGGTGRFDLFYQGANNEGRHMYWANGTGTGSGFILNESLGGLIRGTPSATWLGGNLFNAFVVAKSTPRAYFKNFTPSGWASWQTLEPDGSNIYEVW